MNNKLWTVIIFIVITIVGFYMFYDIRKTRLPDISKDEIMLYVDWNQNINLQQNKKLSQEITASLKPLTQQITAMIGEQQFVLDKETDISASESLIYIKANSPNDLKKVIQKIDKIFRTKYPIANYKISEAGNIFNILFSDYKAPLIAQLRPIKSLGDKKNKLLIDEVKKVKENFPNLEISEPVFKSHLILKTDPELLALYKVDFNQIYDVLKQKFNKYKVFEIIENDRYVPVIIGSNSSNLNEIISETFIKNSDGIFIPFSKLIKQEKGLDLKEITGGKQGEYFPLNIQTKASSLKKIIPKISALLKKDNFFEADFSGSIFDNQKMIKKLIYILLISVLLLYFILASQFESFSLPIIVLSEILVDISGAVFLLYIFGQTINLMSMIGIIVMSGIVINDSILKIDTINMLIKEGSGLKEAIREAGHRRLKPILMTSLTTIFSLVPFLFFTGLGAELQRPLALTIIGGLTIGTFVSLFIVPLFYYFLKRKTVKN